MVQPSLHAAERYRERVAPAIGIVRATRELRRLGHDIAPGHGIHRVSCRDPSGRVVPIVLVVVGADIVTVYRADEAI